ncbi:conserved exported hypothetical protein [Candidatus Desulfarcum epimagneticum]|uniref:Thioredoxin-like fold domain-containing protein n=1 Tax=uncultured Desulfobacteraceae bacterium TaxID=218296 RepID=A0A484HFN2_9BACT|nr:conserved exported hypothetical protein [uncultured Desulfobacteraceae bacterium]
MKKIKMWPALLTLCLFFAGFQTPAASAKGIRWRPVEEGMLMAKEENKKIMMHYYTDWCGYCTKMNQETFPDPGIISYLNRRYISIRVDNDKTRVKGFVVPGVPDTWFLTETGEKIAHQPGFVDSKKLLSILKFVDTESYLKMSFMDFLKKERAEKKKPGKKAGK